MARHTFFTIDNDKFLVDLQKPTAYINRMLIKVCPLLIIVVFVMFGFSNRAYLGDSFAAYMIILFIPVFILHAYKISKAERFYIHRAEFDRNADIYEIEYVDKDEAYILNGKLSELQTMYKRVYLGIHAHKVIFTDVNDANLTISQYSVNNWSSSDLIKLEEYINYSKIST